MLPYNLGIASLFNSLLWCALPTLPIHTRAIQQLGVIMGYSIGSQAAKPHRQRQLVRGIALLCFGLAAAGCDSQLEIRHYEVPKPEVVYAENHVVDPAEEQDEADRSPTDRMLGAIIPQGKRTWYVKMTGPMERVADQEPAFRQLVESFTFADADSPPKWELPPSWSQRPGSRDRFATLVVGDSSQPLEVSVSELPMPDSPQFVLANVNRWRRQMQLPPIAPSQLETETQTLSLSDREAVFVNLVGILDTTSGRPMMGVR
jgi:hypothetical protein